MLSAARCTSTPTSLRDHNRIRRSLRMSSVGLESSLEADPKTVPQSLITMANNLFKPFLSLLPLKASPAGDQRFVKHAVLCVLQFSGPDASRLPPFTVTLRFGSRILGRMTALRSRLLLLRLLLSLPLIEKSPKNK